jgi:NTE family protein
VRRAIRVGVLFALPWVLLSGNAPAQAAEAATSQGVTAPGPTPQTPLPAIAQTKRPKVCLVLSGGGARGAAHVGVLKVLEELRVPIDCITGTSMGSLVGAAYATGSTVPEMEQLLRSISTDLLFKERPPRQELAIRRKLDDHKDYVGPEIGLNKWDLGLPKGFVSGVQLETVLRALAKVKGYYKFDELGIPFRAVATDLVTGKPVIFADGDLANVMRASMSVPGAIAPAEFGGMMLVDGGLTDNLPIDVARAMGADIVIAVNLGTPLAPREELGSVLGVSGQVINILTEQNVQRSLATLKPTDILILPELGDFSAADFDHMSKTVQIGEAAARKVADRLARFSLPPAEYAALRTRQQIASAPERRPIDEIRFVDLHRVNPDAVRAVMDTKPGEPVDQKVLDADLRRIYGTGDFEHVGYRIIEEPGKRVLAIDAVEKSWGPNYLRFGLGFSSDLKGDNFFNALVTYRQTWLNSLGAEWRNDLQFGQTTSLTSEFYQPLDPRQYFFVAPRIELERRAIEVFQGSNRIARYDVRYARGAVDLGSQFTRYGEARLGVLAGKLDASLNTGPPDLAPPPGSVRQGAVTARVIFDQLDSLIFPRTGAAGSANVFASTKALGADDAYTRWDADGTGVWSFGNNTLNVGLKAGGRLGNEPLPRYDLFQWGGFLQQSGYPTGALITDRFAFGRLVYYNKLVQQRLLEGVYAGFSLEAGRYGTPLVPGSPSGTLKSASVFLGADTPIGPLYLGYGRSEDHNSSFYLFLGRP